MSHARSLVAIPDPAPSIPAKFRLYHGGTPKRGHLVTHSPTSGGWLGDYVYFSTVKQYARRYARGKDHAGRGRLFVIDARYLPPGTRIMRTTDSGWPPRSIEWRLFDLIDMTGDLRNLVDLLEQHSLPSLLAEPAPEDVRQELVRHLRYVTVLRLRAARPGSEPLVAPRLVRALKDLQRRQLGPRWAAKLALPAFDARFPAKDCYNSLALFLLDRFGTLDLRAADLRAAAERYRADWLEEFTIPLGAGTLQALREEGVRAFFDPEDDSSARNSIIAIVPGKVHVLEERDRDLPRTAGGLLPSRMSRYLRR
jgi:hypothetical protein